MAIRKRNKNNTEKSVDKNKEKQTSKQIEFRSYKDEAIHVLNILEEQGIDIYDETRKPGMYVEQRINRLKNNKEKSALLGLFENNKQQENTEPSTEKLLLLFQNK